jgi:hypothetical protein
MNKAVKAGTILVACFGVYFLIYPLILLVFAPYPDGDTAQIKSRLKIVVQASEAFCDDGQSNSLSTQRLIDGGYVDKETVENSIATISFIKNTNCNDLGTSRVIAQCDALSAVDPPPLFPLSLRGWPSERLPARRVVIKGNSVTEVMPQEESK